MLAVHSGSRGVSLWLFAVVAAVVLSFVYWPQAGWLSANFQSLLPPSSTNPWIEQANREASSAYDKQILWLVEGRDASAVADYLAVVEDQLRTSGYADSQFEIEQSRQWRALSAVLYPNRQGLLSPADRSVLQSNPQRYFEQFRRLLYSPLGSQAMRSLESDPSGLFASYLSGAAPADFGPSVPTELDGFYWQTVAIAIAPEHVRFDALSGLYDLYRSLEEGAQTQGLTLYATGVPLYSAYGVYSAKLEMSTIGVVSLLLLIGLLLWSLRSVSAVALTLLCVSTGVAGGFVTTVVLLGEIHILTLVFGATLIGIAADYALHYFSHALLEGWTPGTALQRVYKGLLFGMLSSVVAFSALIILPFPGIRQIGLFMASGLLCSFLTVCLLFPSLFTGVKKRSSLPGFCHNPRRLWRNASLPACLLVVTALITLVQMPGADDVRDFYAAPDDLVQAQRVLEEKTGLRTESRYLLLQSSDKEALLLREEALLEQLATLRGQGALSGFSGISQLVPASATQHANAELLRSVLAQGYLDEHMNTLGFSESALVQQRAALESVYAPLDIDAVMELELPLATGGFLGCDDIGCASYVRLTGIVSPSALQAVAQQSAEVTFVDPVEEINAGINTYRTAVAVMLLCAVIFTLGFLSVVSGLPVALRILFLPVATCLGSLLILGAVHGSYSIVNLMALLLVLGVSLDYGIFRAFTQREEQPATALAITLSALTSILAFGLLSFSSTPVISTFGQTITLGLSLAYALSWVELGGKEAR